MLHHRLRAPVGEAAGVTAKSGTVGRRNLTQTRDMGQFVRLIVDILCRWIAVFILRLSIHFLKF